MITSSAASFAPFSSNWSHMRGEPSRPPSGSLQSYSRKRSALLSHLVRPLGAPQAVRGRPASVASRDLTCAESAPSAVSHFRRIPTTRDCRAVDKGGSNLFAVRLVLELHRISRASLPSTRVDSLGTRGAGLQFLPPLSREATFRDLYPYEHLSHHASPHLRSLPSLGNFTTAKSR